MNWCLFVTEIMTCSHEEFMCADKSQCISARWFCDRENDCDDGSDEHECPDTTCEVNYFQCETSLHCIPEVWRCDGDSDCQDHSDENGCASSAPEVLCTVGLFQCGNGDCIHDAWQCDGEDDCGDGTDENRTTCPRKSQLSFSWKNHINSNVEIDLWGIVCWCTTTCCKSAMTLICLKDLHM